MSNYPKVYGFCDAGCRRRVPTYDEFKNSAAYVKVMPDEYGVYTLDVDKAYLIKNPSAVDGWGFTIRIISQSGSSATARDVELIAYDEYADGLEFKLLKILGNAVNSITTNYRSKWEQNGQQSDVIQLGSGDIEGYVGYIEVKSTSYRSEGNRTYYDELEVIMYNEDANIEGLEGKSAYEIAVDNGFVGTEAEWVKMIEGYVLTEDDKQEIASKIEPKGLTPLFSNSIEECTDTTKLYVLPDGYIYGCILTEVVTEGYKNLATPNDVGTTADSPKWLNNFRISSSGVTNSSGNGKSVCNTIYRKDGTNLQFGDVIRVKGVSFASEDRCLLGAVSPTGENNELYNYISSLPDTYLDYALEGDVHKFTIKNATANGMAQPRYVRFAFPTPTDPSTVTITVNEEIKEAGIVKEYAWANTGHAFVPADYEDRIVDLEEKATEFNERIEAVEEGKTHIPTVWDEAINYASNRLDEARNGGVNCVNFLWATDIHAIEEKPSTLAFTTDKTMDEVGKLFGHIARNMMDKADIPLFVATGDLMSQNSYTDTAKVYGELALIKRWLNPIPHYQQALIMGNHDGAWGNTMAVEDQYKNQLPLNEMYNLIYRKQAMDLRRVSGDNGTYYYIDNVPQRMRFIMLNTNNTPDYEALSDGKAKYNRFSGCYCQAQLDWLTNVALNMPEGYTACILGHEPYPSDWTQMVGIVDAYNKRVSFKNTYTHSENTWRNSTVNVNFANATGEIAAVFAGHVHYDYIRNNENNPMYTTCPLITMTTSLGGRADRDLPTGATQPSRSEDNATEFAMDIVTVDTANRKIYMTRLGAGVDREVSY